MSLNELTEKQFRQQILDLAKVLGWRLRYFTWQSLHSPKGFPDVCLVKPPRLVFVELKSESGKLTEAQQEWLDGLRQCPGVEVYLWRPSDWDHIVSILRGNGG